MLDNDVSVKKKYIIAMLASDPGFFVEYAQRNFAGLANGYLLSQHAKPHVTLVQFYGMEADLTAVLAFLKTVTNNPQPRFIGTQFGYDDKYPEVQWAGLTVARDDSLVGLHIALVNLLKTRNITVLNRAMGLYEPHLTFGRIISPTIEFPKPKIPAVHFNLAVGIADDLGQFVKLIHVYHQEVASNSSMQCKL